MAAGIFPATFDDRKLTKNNHRLMLMMRKIKKYIMHSAEDKVLNIDQKDIEQYLSEVKEAVEKDNYRLDRNARRQDNINLFLDYVIDETKAKEIILSLTVMDFSEILQNEHKGFEHEKLYVFDREGKKRFLHRVQERDRVPFAEEAHREEYKG